MAIVICNFLHFQKIMTDQPTDKQSDMIGHMEVALQIKDKLFLRLGIINCRNTTSLASASVAFKTGPL